MAEQINMDTHKLIYHPDRVARWLKGEKIYPIEIEISPSGACNHRCVFCAMDYLGYEPYFLKKEVILRDIEHAARYGLKSVICSGEGEPLLNQELPEIAKGIKQYGVDVAMSSNAALLTKEFSEQCLGLFTWIRFSVASFEQESYDKIQRGKTGDLERVKKNLANAVLVKKEQGLKTTLGVQCLLMPDNLSQLPQMAEELRNMGIDYLTVKPYSQNLYSENHYFIDYEELLDLEQKLKVYETEDFSVYFRANAMKKMHHKKDYEKCLGLPFMTHIDAKGNVWPCCSLIGVEEMCFGNIYKQTFQEIWEGKQREQVITRLWSMDINKVCREACRLDEVNRYLNELKYPGEHVNFI